MIIPLAQALPATGDELVLLFLESLGLRLENKFEITKNEEKIDYFYFLKKKKLFLFLYLKSARDEIAASVHSGSGALTSYQWRVRIKREKLIFLLHNKLYFFFFFEGIMHDKRCFRRAKSSRKRSCRHWYDQKKAMHFNSVFFKKKNFTIFH